MSTPYHARYFAHELTRRAPADGVGRISMGLFDASVDLNPHQIDAALFALRSPLTQGAILADEVGLGKTIEAGLVICQYWAERRRRLLVLCPAALRRQWSNELRDKFNIPSVILDARTYAEALRDGSIHPFEEKNGVVIASFNFASRKEEELAALEWDLVVIDEAHRLRGAWRESNRMGRALRRALHGRRKILLTATPLQNSLMELFGLASILDEQIFGEQAVFRSQYMSKDPDLQDLRERLQGFSKRTLREHVQEYIKYTQRRALTTPFRPADDEHALYEAISNFLLREDTYSIPTRQRQLTVLVLRKLLASSSRAVAATLETMKARLVALKQNQPEEPDWLQKIIDGEELEELLEEEQELEEPDGEEGEAPAGRHIDRVKLEEEIRELERYIIWARGIGVDAKTRALLTALEKGFEEMGKLGAARKALVFTESRRTQEYVRDFLEANGYAGRVVIFNGGNGGPESARIYEGWLRENQHTGAAAGSRDVDRRTALIDYFRNTAEIMIATEAAAEGVNLQFCSLVINYDLPWNPQRIEQRIGRCHRYGQKHDVVVVNFLNERNEADRRVLQLLGEKFRLFTGVFGASDEVLGTIESGVDFEKQILAIYQQCRTPEAIAAAFDELQRKMEESIRARLDETRRILLENFDQDVHARLKMRLNDTMQHLDRFARMFWSLTRFVLRDQAEFHDAALAFDLASPPLAGLRAGRYHMITRGVHQDREESSRPGDAFLYRLSHPLGEFVLAAGRDYPAPPAEVCFRITGHPVRIAVVEALKGRAGWMLLQLMSVQALDREEHLLFSAFTDEGDAIDQETCERMFLCDAAARELEAIPEEAAERLRAEGERHAAAVLNTAMERDNAHYREACDWLDRWAEDKIAGVTEALERTKAQLKALAREARKAPTLQEQHAVQERIAELERKQRSQRRQIFDEEDAIREQRDTLIRAIEGRMQQHTETAPLFVVRWRVE